MGAEMIFVKGLGEILIEVSQDGILFGSKQYGIRFEAANPNSSTLIRLLQHPVLIKQFKSPVPFWHLPGPRFRVPA